MQNLFQNLKQPLVQDERSTTDDGKLLENLIVELGLKLVGLPLYNEQVRKQAFEEQFRRVML